MFCKNCGMKLENDDVVCGNCGTPTHIAQPVTPPVAPYTPTPQVHIPQATVQTVIPEEYQPLSPWAYFGLQILFSLPVVGFIFLLIFTFNGSNLNRRNYARSYWCAALVGVILFVLFFVLAAVVGISMGDVWEDILYYYF